MLPLESAKVAEVEGLTLGVFAENGFERVMTPLLEYVDILNLGLDSTLRDRVVKYIDPAKGQLIGIRPDITPQIARIAASRMRDCPRPLKLCYSESVIRYVEPGGGKAVEILQIGAEQISETPSPEADAAMITMAAEALKRLGIPGFKVDVGDVGFVKAVLDGLNISAEKRERVKNAIAIKDGSALEAIILESGDEIAPGGKEILLSLNSFYGEEKVLGKAMALSGLNDAARAILENLKSILDIVEEKGYKEYVTIDLGEVRGFDYYTGMIMEGFAPGIGGPLLSGGRYDRLLERYGCPSAATGFAFDVTRILEAL